MNYQVVIPAAGQGKRMNAGKNKQFIKLLGDPVIVHTLKVFEQDPACNGIILVSNQNEMNDFKEIIQTYNISKVKRLVIGGSERQHSVFNGLNAITEEGIVLIHDGARPFISQSVIRKVVQKAEDQGAAVVAVPVKDTVKLVKSEIVTETLDRSSLWAIQTPQAFRLSVVLEAHERANKEDYLGTDDASLVERLDKPVHIVKGEYENMKLTTPDDLIYAEFILKQRTIKGGE